jgi:hypothetical protein
MYEDGMKRRKKKGEERMRRDNLSVSHALRDHHASNGDSSNDIT